MTLHLRKAFNPQVYSSLGGSVDYNRKLIDKAMKKGAQYCDIRIGTKGGTSLELKDGEMRKAIYGKETGASIRVLYNNTWGFHSTNNLEPKNLERALEFALRLAKSSSLKVKEKIHLADLKPIKERVIWKPKKNSQDIPIEEKHELVLDMDKAIRSVEGVHTATTGYGDGINIMHFMSSEGTDIYSEVMRTFARAKIIAKKDANIIGFTMTAGGTGGFEVFDRDNPIKKGIEAGKSAVRILSAERCPSGKMPIITDHDLTGVFAHEALGHAAEADAILQGGSCLEGKFGQKIGNDIVTIVDDPTVQYGFGSFPFDDEGVKAKRKILVENGIFKGYILNRESAYKLKMVPNGGARAESYAVRPLVRMSNTFIERGDYSFDELLEDIKLGVYAKGSRGGQVDVAKGAFQFSAQEAFLIEKGELTKPLKDVSFAGSTLEILKSIDAIGKDWKFGNPGSCGKGQGVQWVPVSDGGPHLRVKEAILGGGK